MTIADRLLTAMFRFTEYLGKQEYAYGGRYKGNQQWKPSPKVVHPRRAGTYVTFKPYTGKGARPADTYRGFRRNEAFNRCPTGNYRIRSMAA